MKAELGARTGLIVHAGGHRQSHCHVLVIGSGTSGLGTATELAANGVPDVLVVDHGPFAGFDHDTRTVPAPTCPTPPAGWRSASPHYRVPPGVAHPVGGRSRGWHGVTIPINEKVLRRRWPHRVVEDLLGEDPGSYAAVLRDLTEWRGAPVTTEQNPSDLGVAASWNSAVPEVPVAPVPQAGRCADTAQGRQFWVYSPLLAWRGQGLARHRGLELPTIVHGLQALSLLTGADGVTGALFRLRDGAVRTIMADVVVLAAGTLENTRLFAQALGQAREPVLDWPGLNDHLTHGVVVPLPEPLRRGWAAPDRAFLWAGHEDLYRANLFIDIHAAGLAEPVLDLWWIAQQEEPFQDSVRLEASEPVWPALIRSSPGEADRVQTARRDEFTAGLLAELGVRETAPAVPDAIAVAIGRALGERRAVRYHHAPGIADHEAGTLALGTHLLPGGRATWAPNLYVVGPATFPAAGAANPTLTILALGAQTAREIAAAGRGPASWGHPGAARPYAFDASWGDK